MTPFIAWGAVKRWSDLRRGLVQTTGIVTEGREEVTTVYAETYGLTLRDWFTITVDVAMVALDVQGDTFAPAFSPILFPHPDEENHVVISVARGASLVGTVRAPDGADGKDPLRVLEVPPAVTKIYRELNLILRITIPRGIVIVETISKGTRA